MKRKFDVNVEAIYPTLLHLDALDFAPSLPFRSYRSQMKIDEVELFKERMGSFYSTSSKKMEQLLAKMERTQESCKDLLMWFGEEVGILIAAHVSKLFLHRFASPILAARPQSKTQPEDVFGMLLEFSLMLEKASSLLLSKLLLPFARSSPALAHFHQNLIS